jgi:RecA/RadA recombinase
MAKENKSATVPLTAEQHAENRRKAKRNQKHCRGNQTTAYGSDIFSGISEDRVESMAAARREALEQTQKRRSVVASQPDRAETMLVASNNAIRVVALQIIKNFRVAKANPAEKISRTKVAILMLDSQLTPQQLKNKNVMAGGKAAANKALIAAYQQIEAELNSVSSETHKLVNA